MSKCCILVKWYRLSRDLRRGVEQQAGYKLVIMYNVTKSKERDELFNFLCTFLGDVCQAKIIIRHRIACLQLEALCFLLVRFFILRS